MSASDSSLLVVCLCAQWCGTCRDYRPMLRKLEQPGVLPVWVDIEDHDEVLGDLDIETFPTVLLARHGQVVFLGAVTPHQSTLERLVAEGVAGGLSLSRDPEAASLLERVQAFMSETNLWAA